MSFPLPSKSKSKPKLIARLLEPDLLGVVVFVPNTWNSAMAQFPLFGPRYRTYRSVAGVDSVTFVNFP